MYEFIPESFQKDMKIVENCIRQSYDCLHFFLKPDSDEDEEYDDSKLDLLVEVFLNNRDLFLDFLSTPLLYNLCPLFGRYIDMNLERFNVKNKDTLVGPLLLEKSILFDEEILDGFRKPFNFYKHKTNSNLDELKIIFEYIEELKRKYCKLD